jgi:hypothetical protein
MSSVSFDKGGEIMTNTKNLGSDQVRRLLDYVYLLRENNISKGGKHTHKKKGVKM